MGDGGGQQVSKSGGEETRVERIANRYIGDAIHLFLSLMAVVILVAAALAAYDTVVRDIPKLWEPADEYKVLQEIIENVLLVAIACELGLLLLLHRTSAAVEVILFVIARKIIEPEISALDVLLSVTALAGLLVVRFYFVPGSRQDDAAKERGGEESRGKDARGED
jgi:uncharacterized membrane protein (DUF373 family)